MHAGFSWALSLSGDSLAFGAVASSSRHAPPRPTLVTPFGANGLQGWEHCVAATGLEHLKSAAWASSELPNGSSVDREHRSSFVAWVVSRMITHELVVVFFPFLLFFIRIVVIFVLYVWKRQRERDVEILDILRRESILFKSGKRGLIYSPAYHSISTDSRHPATIVYAPYHAIEHPNYLSPRRDATDNSNRKALSFL